MTPSTQLRQIAADLREARRHMGNWKHSPADLARAIGPIFSVKDTPIKWPERMERNIRAAADLLIYALDDARGYVDGVAAEIELLASRLEKHERTEAGA